MSRLCLLILTASVGLSVSASLNGQSSSLYLDASVSRPQENQVNGVVDRLSPHIASMSVLAVRAPQPRKFAIHDLLTVIIRESIENQSESDVETEKDVSMQGIISAFPNLNISDLGNLQLEPSLFQKGTPRLQLSMGQDFQGEGDYERKDTFTARLTARIADIKPNGTLVIEARKLIRSDEESVNMVMTGTCRKEDITADNTILSTQIYDLRLLKEHQGEVRNATKKGLVTKFFETLFNF